MTFAERFSQLLQHLLRNLLQRRQSVWKALLWGAVTVVVIGFVAVVVKGGEVLQELVPLNRLHDVLPSINTRSSTTVDTESDLFLVDSRLFILVVQCYISMM